jgi:hypothetical protein
MGMVFLLYIDFAPGSNPVAQAQSIEQFLTDPDTRSRIPCQTFC